VSIKSLKRIFGLFTGSLLGTPKLAPKIPVQKLEVPGVRRAIRSKFKQQKRAARIRQKLARRTMRTHRK
jgi:hypothetical protein